MDLNKVLDSLFIYFGGSFESYSWMKPIRSFFGLPDLDMGMLGKREINDKYGGTFQFLGIMDKKINTIVLFIHTIHFPRQPEFNYQHMQVFCVKGDNIFQYIDHNKQSRFSDEELNGYPAFQILTATKDFLDGKQVKEFTLSQDGLASDIVAYMRKPAEVQP